MRGAPVQEASASARYEGLFSRIAKINTCKKSTKRDRASIGPNALVEKRGKFFCTTSVSCSFFGLLGIQICGRKCLKIMQKYLVIQKYFVTLQSPNWSKTHPTS
jgi:hypothetical protein